MRRLSPLGEKHGVFALSDNPRATKSRTTYDDEGSPTIQDRHSGTARFKIPFLEGYIYCLFRYLKKSPVVFFALGLNRAPHFQPQGATPIRGYSISSALSPGIGRNPRTRYLAAVSHSNRQGMRCPKPQLRCLAESPLKTPALLTTGHLQPY